MDKDGVLFLYFVGLFLVSIGTVIIQNSWGWGLLTFGLGCLALSSVKLVTIGIGGKND